MRSIEGNHAAGYRFILPTSQENTLIKVLVVTGATLALVTAAAAADLPHPQPILQQAPIGKMPIGKSPIGKAPIGKEPVGKGPIRSRY